MSASEVFGCYDLRNKIMGYAFDATKKENKIRQAWKRHFGLTINLIDECASLCLFDHPMSIGTL